MDHDLSTVAYAAHAEVVRCAAASYESIRIHCLALAGEPASRPPIELMETPPIDHSISQLRREVRVV